MENGLGTTQVIEHMALELAKLRKDYTDAIAFLPAYDQRQFDKVSRGTTRVYCAHSGNDFNSN